jgi:LPXTG-motif cell wall-anchored protein
MSDMQNSDNQLEGFEEGPAIPPERPTGGGRPFITALTVIGLILLVGLIGLGIVLLTRNAPNATDQAARINAENTQIALAATVQVQTQQAQQQVQQTQEAAKGIPSATLPVTTTLPPTATLRVTNTSVVAIPTGTNTPVPPTATVLPADQTRTAAARTSIALGTLPVGGAGAGTGTPQATATGLPKTGFADQAGLPTLIGIAVLLLVVILVARRLRFSSGR